MKRLLLLLAVLLSLALPAQLTWNATSHDFGTIYEENGVATHTFEATNTSKSAVSILRIVSSCGCTTANFNDSTVAPGEVMSLTAMFTPSNRPGRFSKQVTVCTTDGNYRLTVKGKVVPTEGTLNLFFPEKSGSLRVNNRQLMAGKVTRNSSATVYVAGFNAGDSVMHPQIAGNPSFVTAECRPTAVEPNERFSVFLRFTAVDSLDYGITEIPMTLEDGNGNSLPVTLTATVAAPERSNEDAPSVAVSTDRINFGNLTKTKRPKDTFTLKNNGKTTLLIKKASVLSEALTVERCPRKIEPGESATLKVSCNPEFVNENVLNTEIILFTNDPAAPTVKVRVVGYKE